ncbi:MAG: hypothetical protein PHU75_04170 [Candidatus Nanopelagicales bacterium]|nr:hypothetical protein [Candidatus Nanopelagicales bacterium]
MRTVDLRLDVTDAVGLSGAVGIAVTVTLPEVATLGPEPIVCFAKPGGGYARGYYTVDLPGPGSGVSQAEWHASQGWIFVAVDPLGVGESTFVPEQFLAYDSAAVTAAAHEAERQILELLAEGRLAPDFPAIAQAVVIGIGQSAGGCYTIAQQGRYHAYDGVAILGYSALQTVVPARPGRPALHGAWVPRSYGLADGVVTNAKMLAGLPTAMGSPDAYEDMAWAFHWDDMDPEIVRTDIEKSLPGQGNLPPWSSATSPGMIGYLLGPGNFQAEAAAITSPVLIAVGERDVIPDPRGELRSFLSSNSVDFFVCPRMAHMHNFAGTRQLFWSRIASWAAWVRVAKHASGAQQN